MTALYLLTLVVSIALSIGQATAIPEVVDASYTFEEYLLDTQKQYDNAHEYEQRRRIFHANLHTVIHHNAQIPPPSYTLAINHWADAYDYEIHKGYDKSRAVMKAVIADSTTTTAATKQRRLLEETLMIDHVLDLPYSVDWRHQGVTTPVKSQGMCGSCWAFASTAVLESHLALQTGLLFELSEQQLVSCAENAHHCGGNGGCLGATAELAFDYVNKYGMMQEWDYSYQSGHGRTLNCTATTPKNPNTTHVKGAVISIAGYHQLPSNNYTVLMNAVAKLGPIAVSVAASPWTMYRKGIFDGPLYTKRDTDINHLVVLEGYGTDTETGIDYWLVRNSWSPTWGEQGYIRLKRVNPDTLEDPTTDCGMDVSPADGAACTIDDNGEDVIPPPAKICGTSGILFDTSVPWGGYLIK
jgi:cathepsin L